MTEIISNFYRKDNLNLENDYICGKKKKKYKVWSTLEGVRERIGVGDKLLAVTKDFFILPKSPSGGHLYGNQERPVRDHNITGFAVQHFVVRVDLVSHTQLLHDWVKASYMADIY